MAWVIIKVGFTHMLNGLNRVWRYLKLITFLIWTLLIYQNSLNIELNLIFGWFLPNLAIIWHAMFTVEICYPRQIIVWIKPFVTAALHFGRVNRVSVMGQSCCQFSILILVLGLNQKTSLGCTIFQNYSFANSKINWSLWFSFRNFEYNVTAKEKQVSFEILL